MSNDLKFFVNSVVAMVYLTIVLIVCDLFSVMNEWFSLKRERGTRPAPLQIKTPTRKRFVTRPFKVFKRLGLSLRQKGVQ